MLPVFESAGKQEVNTKLCNLHYVCADAQGPACPRQEAAVCDQQRWQEPQGLRQALHQRGLGCEG